MRRGQSEQRKFLWNRRVGYRKDKNEIDKAGAGALNPVPVGL